MEREHVNEDEQSDVENEFDDEEFLSDISRGLADIEAGRVIPHEEVKRILRDRYK